MTDARRIIPEPVHFDEGLYDASRGSDCDTGKKKKKKKKKKTPRKPAPKKK